MREYKKLKFFETKVVKVKKEKKKGECIGEICIRGKRQPIYLKKDRIYYKGTRDNGNYINGENLDKIKFPCFCSFEAAKNIRVIGMINRGYLNVYKYILTDISQQYDDSNLESALYSDLKDLIKDFNIHILKGKVIIFEEEENNEK